MVDVMSNCGLLTYLTSITNCRQNVLTRQTVTEEPQINSFIRHVATVRAMFQAAVTDFAPRRPGFNPSPI